MAITKPSRSMLSTGISDSSDATFLTADSSENATFAGNLTVSGNLTVTGTTTQVDTVTMNAQNAVLFEGATADAHETTLTTVDPTADRTISLPNVSGTLPVLAAASATAITATPAEINLIDGGTARGTTALASGDGILINDAGTMRMTDVDTVKAFMAFDTDAAQVFNESGAAVDFRIEGDNEQNLFFVDGSTDRIGIGTSSPARSLVLVTEGADNGFRIESADETLMFLGAGASSGTGVDDNWVGQYSQGNLKNVFNANGDSYLSGNLGVGAIHNFDRTLTIGTGDVKTSTTTTYPLAIQTSESSNAGRLSVHYTGAANAADRQVFFQMEEEGVANSGNIIFNPYGGKVGIGSATAPARTFHVNSPNANIASFEGHQGEGVVISSGTNGRIDIIGYDDGASSYNNIIIRAQGSYDQFLIDTSGHVGITAGRRFYLDMASIGSGDTYIDEYSANEVGITTGGSRKLAVSGGNLYVSGSVNANHNFSDERLKENIIVIPNALEKVSSLRGITFTRKADGSVGTGLIAQELEKVLPEAVYEAKSIESLEDSEAVEYKGIRYDTTVGLLVEAIKEQKTIIDNLSQSLADRNQEVTDLENRIEAIEQRLI